MEIPRISRGGLLLAGGTALIAPLALVTPARARNLVHTYQDGVGILSPTGKSLLRVHYNPNQTVTVGSLDVNWNYPAFPAVGSTFYINGCFVSIIRTEPTYIVTSVRTPRNGTIFVGCSVDPSKSVNPIAAAVIPGDPQQSIGYMPNQPGGAQPNGWADCLGAIAGLIGASIAVASAVVACALAPEIEPLDLWALAGACAAWISADLYFQQACGGL